MKFRTLTPLAWVTLCVLCASPASAYYGRHATEATLTYQAKADVQLSGNPSLSTLNHDGRARREALARIDEQVQHLMGTFQSASFIDEFHYPGVLGEHHAIRFTGIEDGSARGRKLLSYEFRGTVVFQKEAFRSLRPRQVPIRLPLAPDLIYDLGVVHGMNRCTDPHYNSEGDFWYFWDPEMPGCPLAGNTTDVIRPLGTLTPHANTRTSYPEYDRLFGDNGNGNTLDLAVFIGYINDISNFKTPNRHDDGWKTFRYLEQDLLSRGFEKTDSQDGFRIYADGRVVKGIDYRRVYERPVRVLGHEIKVRVEALLADTDINSRDLTFHRYLKPAFKNADILVYDGHSGLGGNLDLREIPGIRFDRSKYQIFFFNGCSSYPYFNGMFFDAKGGSRNVDVVTSGLATYSDTAGANIVAFIDRFIDGEPRTWQTILSELEASNGENGTYLTGVSGDEDNLYKPAH